MTNTPNMEPPDDGHDLAAEAYANSEQFLTTHLRTEPMSKPKYVYVASSWRNLMQTGVCAALRSAGIPHYDFKNPEGGTGFSWKQVKPTTVHLIDAVTVEGDPATVSITLPSKGTDWEAVDAYLDLVNHPTAIAGYEADFAAMQRADTFVMVLPCGKSAHLELGWAVGAGKRTIILLEDPVEPELMYRMADEMCTSLFGLLGLLGVED